MLAALVLIAGIALYRWMLSPYSGQLFAACQYKTTLSNAIHKAGVLAKTMRAKREKGESLAKEFERRQKELFTPYDAQKFFGSLQAIANTTGCVIQSVSLVGEGRQSAQNRQKEASEIVGKKTIVTVSGGYGDIIKFMNRIQSYEQKIWIDSFRMDTGGRAGKLRCQVVVTLYCFERVEATIYE